MASGRLIDYLGEGLFSARPAAPDLAAGALGLYYATDTNTLYAWDGSAWDTIGGGGSGAPITATTAEAGTTLTATGANAWNYTRFTNAGTKTYTFDSAQTYANNAEYHGRNVGAGNLTIAQAGSFVITPPVGGSLVIPQGQSFFLKITGTNTADLILQSPSGTGPPATPTVSLAGATAIISGPSGTTSQSPVVPSTAAVNDLLIACIMRRSALTVVPAGWTLAVSTTFTSGGTTQFVDIYYKTAVSGDIGATTTWTQTTSDRMSVNLAAFRKSDSSAFSLVTTNTGTKTASATAYDSGFIPVPAVTATANNQLSVSVAGAITLSAASASSINMAGMIGLAGGALYAGSSDTARIAWGWKAMMNAEVLSGTAQFAAASSGSGNALGAGTALFQ